MAEMAIIYGNRYKSSNREVEIGLNEGTKAFENGDYTKALELALSAINIIEPGIQKKLLNMMES